MIFLPLMLIWLRDPMYFNTPSRWAMVVYAVTVGVLATESGPLNPGDRFATAADADFSGEGANGRSSGLGVRPDRSSVPSGSSSLMREGTRFTNRVGQFAATDNVWYFSFIQSGPDNSETPKVDPQEETVAPPAPVQSNTSRPTLVRIRVLENLALQRVAQIIKQDPSDNRWMIDAVVTEYFGENRLLVVLAVRAPIGEAPQR
jgi:hypothetical protein